MFDTGIPSIRLGIRYPVYRGTLGPPLTCETSHLSHVLEYSQ